MLAVLPRPPAPPHRYQHRSPASVAVALYRKAPPNAISNVALATMIAAATWPVGSWAIWKPGLDESFITAFHMAVQDGLRFGHEIAFIYGPLGFLAFPLPYLGWTSILALAFAGAVHWTLSILLLSFARRAFPIWAAVGLAYLAARTTTWLGVPETTVVLAFIVSVWLLGNRPAPSRSQLVVVAWGIFAGFSMLGKFNTGVVIAAIALLTASHLVRPRWRGVLLTAVSTVTTAVVIWLLMGQRLTDIPPFLRLSVEGVAGYSSAMGLDPGPTLDWLLVAALITLVALGALAWMVSRGWPRSTRLLLLLIGLGVGFAIFKGAFVRWHYLIWFASAIPVTLVLMWDRPARVPSAAVFALTLSTFIAAAGVSPVRYLDPRPQAANAIDHLRTVATPELRHAALTYARESMRQGYPLDPAFLGKIGQHTVHIDPWEAGMAFAFPDLRWQPLPVFQSYGAYTTALDEANADFLASSEAPERIIRTPPVGIDGRFAWFEQPEATVQMVCHYAQLDGSPLFARIPDRCGPEDPIGSVQAHTGQTIDVPTDPRTNRMILARFHGVESSIPARLVAIAWKGDPWSITLNGSATYRLVPGTASDLHILSIPATVGWAAPFDYAAPTRTISVSAGTDGSPSNYPLTVDFFSIPVTAP